MKICSYLTCLEYKLSNGMVESKATKISERVFVGFFGPFKENVDSDILRGYVRF